MMKKTMNKSRLHNNKINTKIKKNISQFVCKTLRKEEDSMKKVKFSIPYEEVWLLG